MRKSLRQIDLIDVSRRNVFERSSDVRQITLPRHVRFGFAGSAGGGCSGSRARYLAAPLLCLMVKDQDLVISHQATVRQSQVIDGFHVFVLFEKPEEVVAEV